MRLSTPLRLLVIPLLPFLMPLGPQAPVTNTVSPASGYRAETTRWRAQDSGFATWQRDGIALSTGGALQLDPQNAHAGTDQYGPGRYRGGNFYNGGTFLVGEAAGPVVTTSFPFSEAVPSWNATTPAGTWIEAQIRARVGTRWTRWYNMGVWTSAQGSVKRHSVSGQADSDAYVDVDTLKIGRRVTPRTATAYQLKLRLFSASRASQPSVENAAVVVSGTPTTPGGLQPGNPANWDTLLRVPECSQMVYPDGGEVWCSPTSVAMVLNYWQGQSGACAAGVRAAVSGVYDRIYDGHGNWPFNAAYAYAAGRGLEAYVTRFTSLAQAEEWVAAGVPVIMSISWRRGELAGAPVPVSNGHLVVLVGFDTRGNPIINDPAAASNADVRRTYRRGQLEPAWLRGSGGTVYLIYPKGKAVPPLQAP